MISPQAVDSKKKEQEQREKKKKARQKLDPRPKRKFSKKE